MERTRANDNDDDNEDDNENLQRRVLQNTLQEVAAREDSEERATTDCCVICLEAISEPCELRPCGHHIFDYLCAVSWLYETPVCPLCKASVSSVVHGPPENRKTTVFDPKLQRASPPPSSTRGGLSSSLNSNRARPPLRRSRPRPPTEHGFPVVGGRRREVYLHMRYSKHVGSNRFSLYRELTPRIFCADNELVSRARMWIRRELQVFAFLALDETDTMMPGPGGADAGARTAPERRRADNAEFLLEYIVAILKSVDIMGSAGQAEDMLSDFLGRENARLFLHELRAWLRSPYTKLEDWDRAVQYDPIEDESTATADSSNTRQTRNGNRHASDRFRERYKRRWDSCRSSSTTERPQRKRHSSRYEPYGNGSRRAEARV